MSLASRRSCAYRTTRAENAGWQLHKHALQHCGPWQRQSEQIMRHPPCGTSRRALRSRRRACRARHFQGREACRARHPASSQPPCLAQVPWPSPIRPGPGSSVVPSAHAPRSRARHPPLPRSHGRGLSTTAACESGWGKVAHRAATMGVAALPLSMYGAPWPSIARLTASRWKAKGDGSATGSPSVLYGKPRTRNFSTVHDEDG